MVNFMLELKSPNKNIYSGHLKLGGKNPQGDEIGFTNYYMELNGAPYFSIVGEFHNLRYNYKYWEDELIKMKMSGVNTIAAYLFWNFIEEEEGCFDWSGNNNVRYFADLCAKHGLFLILRIGPFCHGEVRNGGLPDWLYGRNFEVRSNDEEYLFYVKRLYSEIGKQVSGLLYKDGGPIIGVQLENEFMAATAKWECTTLQGDEWINSGTGGSMHMQNLKKLAIEAGFEVPLYTCTGWGDAPIIDGEILPMYGGYAFCPWIVYWNPEAKVHPPTDNYIFMKHHKDESKYPFACCELGGGMQTWYNYRFTVHPESVEAMIINRVAGGCNFIGYYMYHGGSNPIGKHSYFNERTVPKISYDFLATIGEYGQIRDAYRYIKPLHMFFEAFQDILCPMGVALPEGSERVLPEDIDTLRYTARFKDNSGFLFLSNYQDHVDLKDHEDIQISLKFKDEDIILPAQKGMRLLKGVSAILPFNLDMEGTLLKYSTTQLVTKTDNENESCYFFFAPEGIESEYCFDSSSIHEIALEKGSVSLEGKVKFARVNAGIDSIITINTLQGKTIKIVTLTRKQALGMWKAKLWGRERIIISDSNVYAANGSLKLYSTDKENLSLKVFPKVEEKLTVQSGSIITYEDGIFTSYDIALDKKEIQLEIKSSKPGKALVKIPEDAFQNVNDVFLRIDYIGDIGNAFMDGKLINDNFCNGETWEIGLKSFYPEVVSKGIELYASPIREGKIVINDSNVATIHDFVGKEVSEFKSIKAVPEYRVNISKV